MGALQAASPPWQLLVYLDVQPGAAHCAWLAVSLPTGFVQAFTLGPPSSSPSLHRRGSCGHTSGVTGVPFGSNVPLPCKSPLPFSCLQPVGSGGRRAEWLYPTGGTGRAMSGGGEQPGVPRCSPTRRWLKAFRAAPLLFGADTVSIRSHWVRKGPQASGC